MSPKIPYESPDHCPRCEGKPYVLDFVTGELRPQMCKAPGRCPYCAKVKRRKIFRAAGASDPDVLITLTLAGDDWPTIRYRVNQFIEILRRDGYKPQAVWKVECNIGYPHERDAAWHFHHVHVYGHGTWPKTEIALSAYAQRAGFGWRVNRRDLAVAVEYAPRYVWGKKKVHEVHPVSHAHHLAVNGGRLFHATRRFWRFEGKSMAFDELAKRLKTVPKDNEC